MSKTTRQLKGDREPESAEEMGDMTTGNPPRERKVAEELTDDQDENAVVGDLPPSEVHITTPTPNPSNPPSISKGSLFISGSVQPGGTPMKCYVYNLNSQVKGPDTVCTVTGGTWFVQLNLPSGFPTGFAKLKAYTTAGEAASDMMVINLTA